jgi:hypothetical protein
MVCAFVRVVNNTNTYVHYYNTERQKRITVPPKSEQQENNDWIPAESCDDWVPYEKKDGDYIEVCLGNSGPVRISDDNYRWKFVNYPDGDAREGNEFWVKGLEPTQYVLLFQPVNRGGHTQAAISIYKYDSQSMGTTGYIIASVLQSAAPVVALVLMAIFL